MRSDASGVAPQRLDEDVLAYIDRDYQWNAVDASGLPYELLGAQYVQTALADKTNAQLAVTLSLNRPTTLFLFASEDIPIPGWLIRMGFVATGLKIGLDLDSTARQSLGRGAETDARRARSVAPPEAVTDKLVPVLFWKTWPKLCSPVARVITEAW